MELLSRVDVKADRVEIKIHRRRLIDLLAGQAMHSTQGQTPGASCADFLTLTVPARLKRVGREMRMLVENSEDERTVDPGLLRCLIPDFDGAVFSIDWKEALWARFFTAAPQRRRRSVEQYKIVKRA